MTFATIRGRYDCARCDWQPERPDQARGRDALAEHAETAGHPLCSVCRRSLEDADPVVCESCITRSRARLGEIATLYALLPEQLGRPAGQSPGGRRGGGDGAPLPGGAALVLLGPGSNGTERRRLTSKEELLGAEGREHGVDNQPGDLVSVAYALRSWENDWRETRGERELTTPATVTDAAGYLERRMRWAANGEHNHPPHSEFPTFVDELAAIRDLLEQATNRRNDPERAPVPCLDCGRASLRRAYRRPDRCAHPRPVFSLSPTDAQITERRQADRDYEPPPLTERRHRRDMAVAVWEETHKSCDQGGLVGSWVCRLCDRSYTSEEYQLAQADWMRDLAGTREWGRPWQVAASLGVSVETVRTWVKRQQVSASCSVQTRRLEVFWPEVRQLADEVQARAAAREAVRDAARAEKPA